MSKTANGLVEYSKAQLGKPYWWGTFGQIASASLYAQKKAQYPSYYTASDFPKQYGQRVHDCVGLIKGYRWSDTTDSTPKYNGAQDVAVTGLYKQCGEKGAILTMPDTPGVCVFMGNMGHVGVYIGDGEVIEAMGHAYGVVKTKLKSRGWAYWGKPDWIDYGQTASTSTISSSTGKTVAVTLNQLSQGDTGAQVETAQRQLIGRGFSCGPDGADGDFGANTAAAVKSFQQKNGLTVDGIIGAQTWAKLLKG